MREQGNGRVPGWIVLLIISLFVAGVAAIIVLGKQR
jgi:hypothetical protein